MKNILFILITFALLAGCADNANEESLTIEMLHARDGIPVETSLIAETNFELIYTYNGVMRGKTETVAVSKNADRVSAVNFGVGDTIKKGDIVIEFPEDNPALQYHQARLAYENSEKTWLRMKALYNKGGISKQDLDQVETVYLVNKANWENLKKIVMVESPAGGYITQINFDVSENVAIGDPLFTVSDISTLRTRVWATEDEITHISAGQEAVAELSNTVLNGRVIQTALHMDANRQAYSVELEFENPDKHFAGGMTATVKITVYRNPEAIVISRQYVFTDPDKGLYCYISDGNRALKRYISPGRMSSLNYEIIDGLEVGELLITRGAALVSDESLIKLNQ